jgi:hypothetical protein
MRITISHSTAPSRSVTKTKRRVPVGDGDGLSADDLGVFAGRQACSNETQAMRMILLKQFDPFPETQKAELNGEPA